MEREERHSSAHEEVMEREERHCSFAYYVSVMVRPSVVRLKEVGQLSYLMKGKHGSSKLDLVVLLL